MLAGLPLAKTVPLDLKQTRYFTTHNWTKSVFVCCVPHLDLYTLDLCGGTNDGSSNQRGEDVGGEVGSSIATLDKLTTKKHSH